jgi:SAM-dependent methyltransferase
VTMQPTIELMEAMLHAYGTPSQAAWRAYELAALRRIQAEHNLQGPVLEIGCGEGGVGAALFSRVDDAVDINERAVARAAQLQEYVRVHLMNAAQLELGERRYNTILANCVLEHIPEIHAVLRCASKYIAPSGFLVATVPLREMNNWLSVQSQEYAESRRIRLTHVNLWTQDEWASAIVDAGFKTVDFIPYLTGMQCKIWDRIDRIACFGHRRYSLSNCYRVGLQILPGPTRRRWHRLVGEHLVRKFANATSGPVCAAVFIARP